jgi:pimeloyl-ACP methyl ester carboxylesterase
MRVAIRVNMSASFMFALALAACAPSFAADAPVPQNRYAASKVPAERFEVGSMLVERHGERGPALILIPGLAGGAWVWQDTLREFSGEHVLYVVTLAGFDGRPAIPGKVMDAARESLEQLIASRQLARPVLVGHSLGGTLALAVAAQHAQLVGGVVSIDGLPVFPGTEDIPAAQRAPMAETAKARLAAVSAGAFAARQQQYMRGIGVLDMAKADELAKLSANSDVAAVAQYLAEVLAQDLRSALPAITVPVLLISPYFDLDGAQSGTTAAMQADYYRALMAGTPRLEVVSVSPARHFAMFDQGARISGEIRRFLDSLQKGPP